MSLKQATDKGMHAPTRLPVPARILRGIGATWAFNHLLYSALRRLGVALFDAAVCTCASISRAHARRVLAFFALLSLAGAPTTALADGKFIVVQSTTSTQNSGLFDHLLPQFNNKTGIDVRVVAVGTGQAIRNARNGDGDVLLVHATSAEEEFVANADGVQRHDLMYNDFVIVGPNDDPARIAGINDITVALTRLANASALFASRGDDSGTHKKELSLWELAGIDVVTHSGTWYRETGSGMGATLNVAVGMGAYTLTDRATWISFQNKERFGIHVEGDRRLFNQYGIVLVNPQKHPHVKARLAQQFIDWLLSDEGQQAIAGYQRDGQQLFFPNAQN